MCVRINNYLQLLHHYCHHYFLTGEREVTQLYLISRPKLGGGAGDLLAYFYVIISYARNTISA